MVSVQNKIVAVQLKNSRIPVKSRSFWYKAAVHSKFLGSCCTVYQIYLAVRSHTFDVQFVTNNVIFVSLDTKK